MTQGGDRRWAGAFAIGRDIAVFLGQAGDTRAHRHLALQLVAGASAASRVDAAVSASAGGVTVIPSLTPHRLLPGDGDLVLVFAEPRFFDSADLSARLSSWVRDDGNRADVLLERLQEARRADRIEPTLRAFVERIDASLDSPLLVSDLAAWRRVSTSQLERQLRNALGTPARQLMIWRRLRVAFTRIVGGASLTHAALDAGFVDSAHFSRTVRRHFGVRADRVFGR